MEQYGTTKAGYGGLTGVALQQPGDVQRPQAVATPASRSEVMVEKVMRCLALASDIERKVDLLVGADPADAAPQGILNNTGPVLIDLDYRLDVLMNYLARSEARLRSI